MSNKITLASFEIENLDALIGDTGELIKKQTLLRESSKELDKTTSAGATQFAKNSVEIKSLGKQISSNNKLIQATTGVTNDLTSEINKEIATIAQARASNTKLLEIRNQLNLKTKEGRKANEDINKQLDSNNAFIKENVSAYEKQKIGIGDYTTAIKEAFAGTGGFSQQLGILTQGLNTLAPITDVVKKGFADIKSEFTEAKNNANGLTGANKLLAKANATSSASFKVLKLAIASTGIGLLLVALGSLVAFLGKTQKGIDLVTSVTRPLQAVFSSLLGVAQQLGEKIFNTFSNPKQALKDLGELVKNNLINRFKAFGVILDGILSLDFKKVSNGVLQATTGVENLTDKVKANAKEASNFLGDAIAKGKQIDQLKKEEEKAENALILLRAQNTAQIKQQELIAKDKSKTDAERNMALKTAIALSDELSNSEKQLLALKINRTEIENTLNDTSRADQAELNKLKAESIKQDEQNSATKLRFLGVENQLQNEAIANAKKATDQAIKDNELRLKLFIQLNQTKNGTLEESLAFEKQLFLKSSKNLEIQLKAQNATTEQAELARLELKQEYLDKQTALTVDNAGKELALLMQQNQTLIDNGKFITDELLKQELDRIDLIANAKAKKLQLERDNNLISELEFLTKKGEQEDAFNAQRESVKETKKSQDKAIEAENLAIEFEEKLLRLEEEDATLFEIDRERVARDQAIELLDIEQNVKNEAEKQRRINEVNKKAKDANIAIKKEETKVRVDAAQQAFGDIAQLLGQETAAGKAAGVAQATISTYQGVNRVWEAPSTLPEPFGTAQKVLSTATVIASGLSSVRKIASTPIPKAERGLEVSSGGLLQGRRHNQGGILIEAEDGEMIMNRSATSMFLPQLREMQKIGNGNTGFVTNSFARDGGITARSVTSSINEVIVSNLQDIRVVNVASDTIDIATEESIIVQNANI